MIMSMTALRDFYPAIEPRVNGFLSVDDIHRVYWEECGNPDGIPVLFLHGGPGGGCSATSRRYFDPTRFRILLMDQRGAGRSTPNGETRNNTTSLLIQDLEALRSLRGIERWHLFGGSWGSTLAVAYAQAHPNVCLGLTLRGIFMMQQAEIRGMFETGRLFRPEALQALIQGLPPELRAGDPLLGYSRTLDYPDRGVSLAAARCWSTFEATLANLVPDAARLAGANDAQVANAMARIEVHYFLNNRYDPDDHLLREAPKIAHIPTTIVQGRYDLLCPPMTAMKLHTAMPGSRLVMIEDAGHSATEPGTKSALIAAMDRIADGQAARHPGHITF
jgi:proline iminopeptidase